MQASGKPWSVGTGDHHVAIVGGGFSGALLAVNLLRLGAPRVTLIERSGEFGRGLAYSTGEASHLLNVPASNMSALHDQPDHFANWLAREGLYAQAGFASRRDYGRYIGALIAEAQAAWPGQLELVSGSCLALSQVEGRKVLTHDNGEGIVADTVALALGNLAPLDPPALAAAGLPVEVYRNAVNAGDLAEGLGGNDTVLIVGTGLTMIDTVLSLDKAGFSGRIVALSRRGLVPRSHSPDPVTRPLPLGPYRERGTGLLRRVRADAEVRGWREAIDALRPYSQGLWMDASEAERRRFLRHLRAWWDVHRHRLAPQIAARIDALRASGRLQVVAGRILEVAQGKQGARVVYRPRHDGAPVELDVRRIFNCTGPQCDLSTTSDPLLSDLVVSGAIRPDRLRLGIDVTSDCEVIGRNGQADPQLFALGPLTRGMFWEINAVPDIRTQVWQVAQRIAQRPRKLGSLARMERTE